MPPLPVTYIWNDTENIKITKIVTEFDPSKLLILEYIA